MLPPHTFIAAENLFLEHNSNYEISSKAWKHAGTFSFRQWPPFLMYLASTPVQGVSQWYEQDKMAINPSQNNILYTSRGVIASLHLEICEFGL